MNRVYPIVAAIVIALAVCAPANMVFGEGVDPPSPAEAALKATEIAFAKTMADRDHSAFAAFLDKEGVFSGPNVHRGRDAIAAAWAGFFEGETAPFSWEPEFVAVLGSGKLGTTSGPVFDADGKRIGTFNSVWRMQADGAWKVIFDRGCPPCDCP